MFKSKTYQETLSQSSSCPMCTKSFHFTGESRSAIKNNGRKRGSGIKNGMKYLILSNKNQ